MKIIVSYAYDSIQWTHLQISIVLQCHSYHFDGAEGGDGVAASAVGPGVPARVLALLKHILLTLTVGLLVAHPPAGGGSHSLPAPDDSAPSKHNIQVGDLRSAQHQDRTHFVQARLLQVVAGSSQLMAAALEVLLLVDHQLWRRWI